MTPSEVIAALEVALEAATPGTWKGLGANGKYDNSENSWSCHDEEAALSSVAPITLENGVIVAFAVASSDNYYSALKSVDANAAFIAACSPLAIRTLLDAHASALMDAERLRKALSDLLDDTQHSEHFCGDPECPVDFARAALDDNTNGSDSARAAMGANTKGAAE